MSDDKTEEATTSKLEKAREEGQMAQSKELAMAVQLGREENLELVSATQLPPSPLSRTDPLPLG